MTYSGALQVKQVKIYSQISEIFGVQLIESTIEANMQISETAHPRILYCIPIFIILKVNKNMFYATKSNSNFCTKQMDENQLFFRFRPKFQLRVERLKKFQKWSFSTPHDSTFEHTKLFSSINPSGQKIGFKVLTPHLLGEQKFDFFSIF